MLTVIRLGLPVRGIVIKPPRQVPQNALGLVSANFLAPPHRRSDGAAMADERVERRLTAIYAGDVDS
jgi:hypothetical protein